MADTPATPKTEDVPVAPKTLVVADVTPEAIFLVMEDGRHVFATIKDGLNLNVKPGDKVAFTSDGFDSLGAPGNVVITKIV